MLDLQSISLSEWIMGCSVYIGGSFNVYRDQVFRFLLFSQMSIFMLTEDYWGWWGRSFIFDPKRTPVNFYFSIPCWMLQVCLFSVLLLFELPRNWTSVLSRRVGAHTNDRYNFASLIETLLVCFFIPPSSWEFFTFPIPSLWEMK